MGIIWERTVGDISEDIINKVEKKYGIQFPDDYRECVKNYNGGHPVPNIFSYDDGGEGVFDHLLSFTSEPNIVVVYEFISDFMPKGIFPFGTDPFGNQLCFDYRKSENSPLVVFLNNEEFGEDSITEVCNSFSELLETLHEASDEFY